MTNPERTQHASQSDWRLRLIVFVSGAVLMGLEITGSRILAAHFGSSIYVWGAVIAVFLAALSGGYYIGGMVADRKPNFLLLNILLLIAGSWLLVIPFYANWLSDVVVSRNLGERFGPLLTSLLLFGGPSVLMGMVSPYAVRLATKSIENIGNVAGRLYALSTVGSIVGTLVTAFWLIPLFGVKTLLQVLGLCLVVVSPLVLVGRLRLVGTVVTLLAFLLVALTFGRPPTNNRSRKIVFEGDSAYHQISVIDDEQLATRRLQFNRFVQTSISLNPPYETRAGYTDSFHLAYIFNRNLKRILIIGGGGGVGPRKFIKDYPDVTVDLVEIDPRVVEVSFKYFHLQSDPRLNIFVQDGRNFIRRTRNTYDLVILDAFTIGGQIPFQLTTSEFMQEIKNVLNPNGILLTNLTGAMRGKSSQLVRAEYKTVLSVFPRCYAFPRLYESERQSSVINPDRRRSIILIATKSSDSWDSEAVLNRAIALQGSIQVSTFVDDARQFLAQPFKMDDVPLLTDDYAPVDTLGF